MPATSAKGNRFAYILLTLAAVAFGGTWVAGKLAVDAIPPFTIAAARFAIASGLLWAWTRLKGVSPRPLVSADLPIVLAMGLTAVVGYNVLFLNGLKLAPASDGAILVPAMAPTFTAALAWPLLRERLSPTGVAGFAVAMFGLVLVVRPGVYHVPGRILGDVLFLLGAALWSVYTLVGKQATARYTAVNATLYATVCGTIILIPFALAERGWLSLVTAPLTAWAGLIYLAVFGTVVSFVFFYEGINRVGAVRASAFALLVPVFGVVTTVIILHERLSLLTVAGGVLVLAGLWCVQRGSVGRSAQ